MLVHALRARRARAGWLVGALDRRRAAQRPAGARASGWSSRPTSPTARCSASRSRSRVLTNVELDHHASFGSLAELREAFGEFLARPAAGRGLGSARAARASARLRERPREIALRRARAVDARPRGGSRFQLARARGSACGCPGAHNALNAAAALEAARLAGADAARAIAGLAAFRGRRAALSAARRSAGGALRVRRLRPPPDRGRRDPAGRAHAWAPAPGGSLPAPSVLAHRAAGARVRRGARARRRGGGARRVPRARARRGPPGGERPADRRGRG